MYERYNTLNHRLGHITGTDEPYFLHACSSDSVNDCTLFSFMIK